MLGGSVGDPIFLLQCSYPSSNWAASCQQRGLSSAPCPAWCQQAPAVVPSLLGTSLEGGAGWNRNELRSLPRELGTREKGNPGQGGYQMSPVQGNIISWCCWDCTTPSPNSPVGPFSLCSSPFCTAPLIPGVLGKVTAKTPPPGWLPFAWGWWGGSAPGPGEGRERGDVECSGFSRPVSWP